MLFQDKMQALLYLLIRNGMGYFLEREFEGVKQLEASGLLDGNFKLTDKGWETANRLANEFGELL